MFFSTLLNAAIVKGPFLPFDSSGKSFLSLVGYCLDHSDCHHLCMKIDQHKAFYLIKNIPLVINNFPIL